MEPRNRFRGIDFASLCSLAARYDRSGYRSGPPGWESIPGCLKRSTNTGSGLAYLLRIPMSSILAMRLLQTPAWTWRRRPIKFQMFFLCYWHCSGSGCFWPPGSASGSVNYLYGSGSYHQQTKKWRKTTWFQLFCDFFATFYLWRMMQMYLQKGISIKNFNIFCWRLEDWLSLVVDETWQSSGRDLWVVDEIKQSCGWDLTELWMRSSRLWMISSRVVDEI
jgi:hypothetical protein